MVILVATVCWWLVVSSVRVETAVRVSCQSFVLLFGGGFAALESSKKVIGLHW
jgi:hypothetical protein